MWNWLTICWSVQENVFLSFFLSWDIFFLKEKKFQERKKEWKTFASTISMGKKEKTEDGDEDVEGVKKNPEEI